MANLEMCCDCGMPTGRAGIGEDSLYAGDYGSYCEECWSELLDKQAARIRELEAENKALREGRGVKVKPLEWRDSYGVLRAKTPFGDYMVTRKVVKMPVTSQAEMVSDDPKAAAQADYERRILSALPHAPVSVGDVMTDAEFASRCDSMLIFAGHPEDYPMRVKAAQIIARHLPAALRALSEGEG